MIDTNGLRLETPGADDFDRLAELWEGAVRVTHHFLAETDIEFLRPLVGGQFIPEAQPINLRTGGNWNGHGVIPDVIGGDDPLHVARRVLEKSGEPELARSNSSERR